MSAKTIVVGAGHNGLVAALSLAKAGHKVLVLEAREHAGGICARHEFHPGYAVPGLIHDHGTLSAEVLQKLGLDLEMAASRESVLGIDVSGRSILIDQKGSALGEDAAGFKRWQDFIATVRPILRQVLATVPPAIAPGSVGELFDIAGLGLRVRRLGKAMMYELMRVPPMSASDWLEEHFEDSLLQATLALPGLFGSGSGPRSPGTSANVLLHEVLVDRRIVGGPARLTRCLLEACDRAGVEVKTSAQVSSLRTEAGRVVGLILEGGEEIAATTVVAACDPKKALLDLVPPADLDLRLERQITGLRSRGPVAKLHLALSAPLAIAGASDLPETIRLVDGDLDAMEQAYDATKYRQMGASPQIEIRRGGTAPAGHETLSVMVGFVPSKPDRVDWTEAGREALSKAVLDRIAAADPGLRDKLVATEVLTPDDITSGWEISTGHLLHADHALDQLLNARPAPMVSRYATPIAGFYLGSGGCHPVGGLSGLPGLLAAKVVSS